MISELSMGIYPTKEQGREARVRLYRPVEEIDIQESEDLRLFLNALHEVLQEQPHKIPYPESAGGILNAYREGDVGFDEAVNKLERRSSPTDPT